MEHVEGVGQPLKSWKSEQRGCDRRAGILNYPSANVFPRSTLCEAKSIDFRPTWIWMELPKRPSLSAFLPSIPNLYSSALLTRLRRIAQSSQHLNPISLSCGVLAFKV